MSRNRPERVVNLDALLKRDDFFVETKEESESTELRASDLEPGITFNRLRKPDFQRETANWTPQQVVDLIETFAAGDIIPAIILWESGSRIFVVDGAHRLSALIGWIHSDFGAGSLSQKLYGSRIPPHQRKLHDVTMDLVTSRVGLWEQQKEQHPTWSLKPLQVQWIRGRTAEQAAKAFVRINQGGTEIDPLEVRILQAARSALSVATRVVVRGGTGHPYWNHFSNNDAKTKAPKLGEEIYKLLYEPELQIPIKTVELPLAGAAHGPHALRLAFDLVGLANGLSVADSTRAKPKEQRLPDDSDGDATLNYLKRTAKVTKLILSDDPSSFGLHPALWFYSSNGSFQPAALLNVTSWLLGLEARNQTHTFRRLRGRFEDLILDHPTIIKPATNKLGSGARTRKKMVEILDRVLVLLGEHSDNAVVWQALSAQYASLRRDEEEEQEAAKRGTPGAAFPLPVKNAAALADLRFVPRCKLCGGLLHRNGKTLDHQVEKSEGGLSSLENSRYVHPICNANRKKDSAAPTPPAPPR